MAIITKLEEQKKNKNRISIYLDGKYAFGIYKATLLKSGIKVKDEIDSEEIKKFIADDDFKKAVNLGLNYLSYKPRTKKEVFDKLILSEVEHDTAVRALNQIEDYGYINDADYTSSFIDSNIDILGPRNIMKKLTDKGIDQSKVDEYLEDKSETFWINKAMDIAVRKNDSFDVNLDYQKRYTRLTSFLVRKGYDYGIVKAVVAEILASYKKAKMEYKDEHESQEVKSEEVIYEEALVLAKKKCRTYSNDLEYRKKYDRLCRHLLSKGFSYDVIKKIVKEVLH